MNGQQLTALIAQLEELRPVVEHEDFLDVVKDITKYTYVDGVHALSLSDQALLTFVATTYDLWLSDDGHIVWDKYMFGPMKYVDGVWVKLD